ncbi:uncharacterized protein LOC135808986 [Sycon ciliatum]|uniref:uncharacterized protein LOC135808986 n=1 Tax=Sycon ciliatum TaxID=27933 RepID=UPI0031F61DB9
MASSLSTTGSPQLALFTCVMLLLSMSPSDKLCAGQVNGYDPTFDDTSNFPTWLHLARLCAASYESPNDVRNGNCQVCTRYLTRFTPSAIVENGNFQTSALIGFDRTLEESGTIVVAFRGTNNLQNWIQNIDFRRVVPDIFLGRSRVSPISRGDIGLVHMGFLDAYMSLRAGVLAAVTQLRGQYPQAPINITGHSLGGAIAALCALDLEIESQDDFPVRITMTDFGAPRVGSEDWVEVYSSRVGRSLRVVHRVDLVPKLPLAIMGFKHDPRYYLDPRDSLNPLTSHVVYLGIRISNGGTPVERRRSPSQRRSVEKSGKTTPVDTTKPSNDDSISHKVAAVQAEETVVYKFGKSTA